MIFQQDCQDRSRRKTVFSTTGFRKAGCPHAREENWTFTSHHTQKLTLNGSKINTKDKIITCLEENRRERIHDIRF